jgi:hypothetical protein
VWWTPPTRRATWLARRSEEYQTTNLAAVAAHLDIQALFAALMVAMMDAPLRGGGQHKVA